MILIAMIIVMIAMIIAMEIVMVRNLISESFIIQDYVYS